MINMRFINYINKYRLELLVLLLILFFGYIYFYVYLTPDRATWYNDMTTRVLQLQEEIIKKLSQR